MTKSMAVIGRVIETAEISGADFIQQARVDCGPSGTWRGVVGKDLEVGTLVTVFLQDALLPPDPRWAFMEKHKWRVRMARFKGVPSECLIIPGAPDMPVGTDMTEALGVVKYEKPIPVALAGDMAGSFPSFIPKTDEANFQTVPELVERLADGNWYAAEKADGTSCTVWNDDAGMHVCSRNWELRETNAAGAKNAYWQAARKYDLTRIPQGFALQFEVVGPGIQSNPMGLRELEARAFSLYDTTTHTFASVETLRSLAGELGIPLVRQIEAPQRLHSDDELRALAEIRYANGKHGEGVVIRANDSSWSFKVINLKYEN